jgi:CheY-like chemotaxis protein
MQSRANELRVMVVDDHPAPALMARLVAQRMGTPARVITAGSLREARAAMSTQPELTGFIIDVGLPDGSGITLASEARKACPHAPILIVTGGDVPHAAGDAFDLEVSFMPKPVSAERMEVFLRRVFALVAARGERPPGPPFVGPRAFELCVQHVTHLLGLPRSVGVLYALGRAVACVKGEPERFGSQGVKERAARTGSSVPLLYRHAGVAERWTEEEVAALMIVPPDDEGPVTWSHLELIAPEDDANVRDDLLAQVRRDGLSVAALRRAMREPTTGIRFLAGGASAIRSRSAITNVGNDERPAETRKIAPRASRRKSRT